MNNGATMNTQAKGAPSGADTYRDFLDYAQEHYDVAVWSWIDLGIQWMIARGPWRGGTPKWS